MNLADFLLKYWEFLGFIAFVVFYSIYTYFRVDNHEKRLIKLEDNKEIMNTAINGVNERLSGMDGKLDILVEGYKRK